jgi:glycosyltransferase involved in cell wall biosynthesis
MNLVFVESSRRAWGSEQHFVDLAKGCHAAGHRVVAVVRAGSDVANLLVAAGLDVRQTPFRGGADPRALFKVLRAVREIGAEWLVTDHQKHYWALYLIARLTGSKLAVFRHMAYVRSWFNRVLFPLLVDRFFVVSDFALETLVKAGAPRERLTRLYNPVDLRRFKPCVSQRAATRKALDLPPNAVVAGFVGRHELGKGVQVLREALALAMARDERLHAVWVGSGPEWSNTRARSESGSYSHRHRFVEWTHSPEHYYVAFDCLIAPSQALETFGRVVAEAQACGVPVIASRVGGLAEAFEPGHTGRVFEGMDAESLAESMLSLLREKRERARMSEAGRRFVVRFELATIVNTFIVELGADRAPVVPPVDPRHVNRTAPTLDLSIKGP